MFERFVFNGISSNEYDITCVTFESSSMATIAAQETNLETQKSIRGDIFHITSQEYSKPLEYKMQVVKRDYSPISPIQERALKKWLCQKGTYKSFCILDKQYADTWFFVNINNPKSIYVGNVVGLEFTVTTNAPFGFSDIRHKKWTLNAGDIIDNLYVSNDEELPIYPEIIITMSEHGTLTLINNSIVDLNNTLIIKNCTAGEVITLECGYPYISSSLLTHQIFSDFNKYWPYFIDGFNRISVDKSCVLECKYREYRKVAIV